MFFLGILLLAFVLYMVDFYAVLGIIITFPPGYLLLLLLVEAGIILVSAVKWRIVLRGTGVSLKNILSTTMVGYFVNNITPIGIAGGEPVRAYLLYKIDKKVTLARAFASVLVDLFLEILPIFVLALVAIGLILSQGIEIKIALMLSFLSLILLALFVTFISMVLRKSFSDRTINLFVRITSKIPGIRKRVEGMKPRLDEISENFSLAMKKNVTDKQVLIYGTIISFVKWFLTLTRVFLVFQALKISITFTQVSIAEIAVIIFSGIPLLPGALGIWEGASVILFTQIAGISPAEAAAATIADRFLFYLLPSVIGAGIALRLGVDIIKSGEISDKAKIKAKITKG